MSACSRPGNEPSSTTAKSDTDTPNVPSSGTQATPSGTTDTPSGTTSQKPQEKPTPSEPVELELEWHKGRIQSNMGGKIPQILTATDHMYSDVIEIPKAGTEIRFTDSLLRVTNNNDSVASRFTFVISSWTKYQTGSNVAWIHNKNGINISGASGAGSPIEFPKGDPTRTSVTYRYVTSEDNESIRLCFASLGNDKMPTVYMTENVGSGTKNSHYEFLEESKEKTYDNNLKGITMALFGDSYLAGNALRGEYTWAKMLSDKYGMTLYNHSIGGSTVSDKVTTNTPLVQRWNNDCGTPNIIVIEGGRNDSNTAFGIDIGTNTDTTTHTFKGALIFMLRNLREKYPNAMIVGITSYNSPDRATTIEYARAMRELFDYYGFPCINAADPAVSGVDTSSAVFREKYMEYPTDYSHLNYEGHKMALPYFEAAMSKCYADFLGGKYNEKRLPSGDNSGSSTTAPPSSGDIPEKTV